MAAYRAKQNHRKVLVYVYLKAVQAMVLHLCKIYFRDSSQLLLPQTFVMESNSCEPLLETVSAEKWDVNLIYQINKERIIVDTIGIHLPSSLLDGADRSWSPTMIGGCHVGKNY